MPMDKPTCKKCNQRHWGYDKCERGRPVQIIRQPLPDGVRAWGDHGETRQHTGGNVFDLTTRPKLVPGANHTPPPPKAA